MTKFIWQNDVSEIVIDGVRLEAACYGPAPIEAPTLVLLHEGLGCVELWRDFPQELSKRTGHGVFVYSRAGYGKSDPVTLPRPLDYMSREALDVLPKVLEAIGFKSGVLLGHSDGASIAAIYAGSVEDFRVRGLILMAPHFFTEETGLASIAASRKAFDEGDLRTKLAKYHSDVENAFKGWCDAWLDPDFEEWNIAESIDYWRIPVLAMQGKDDQYGTQAQIAEIESRIYSPVDAAILENCRHSPHLEKMEETLDIVSEYLTRLQRIENEKVATQ